MNKIDNLNRPTRGKGLLEPFLAYLRAKKANKLIPDKIRQGRILDIGCGSFPYFLSHTAFREKFAVDQQTPYEVFPEIMWHVIDLSTSVSLPFSEDFFHVITMLAVIEHLNPSRLTELLSQVYRILSPGGLLIITTPTAWSSPLLKWMSKIFLVSADEINDHKYTYTLPLIGWYFGKVGFEMEKVKYGYFEGFLNMWGLAEK